MCQNGHTSATIRTTTLSTTLFMIRPKACLPNVVYRSYSPLSSTGDDDEVTIVEPPEVKEVEEVREEEREVEMEGGSATDALWREKLELARKGKENRKAAATATPGQPKRLRKMIMREPSSRGGSASSEPSIERSPQEDVQATEATRSDPPSSDKGKGADVQTVNFTLPSDFIADYVLDRAKILTHLSKYLLPQFIDRFKTMRIDDVGSHVSGLAFMTLQDSLGLYGDMERIRQVVPLALNREKATLDRERGTQEELERARMSLVVNEKNTRDAKEREAKQKVGIEELEEELKMDLKTYLMPFGNEDDLNSEDEKDVEMVEVDADEAKVDETPAGDVSTSTPREDSPLP
ncbi:hypothetical protein L6452_26215 [Arctium lappa]|uniref:Uncharacterized protein n=1 Tax=Arctium lappa TaxID=4217 RepID=A0ACB9AD91_ARCLA|nr:hypothetical protein L6452_26215 [Arctium lappa]